jgi:hypothetical protein
MIPNNLIHKRLKTHIVVYEHSVHIVLLPTYMWMYKYTCVDTDGRQTKQRTERHSNITANLNITCILTQILVGGGAKFMLLQGTAVVVKILRNTYVQCVRKCKMHVLKFQAFIVCVWQVWCWLYMSVRAYVRARVCKYVLLVDLSITAFPQQNHSPYL